MFDPEDVLDPMIEEIQRLLAEMKDTRDLEQKKTQSEILKNVCTSLGVFFDFMSDALEGDMVDFLDEEEEDEEDY